MEETKKKRTRSGSEKRERTSIFGFRATDAERAEITEAAARAGGLTPSAYARSRLLAVPTLRASRRRSVEVQAITRLQGEVNKVGGNIYQLLRNVNFGGTPMADEVREAFKGYKEVIAAILATLNREPRDGQGAE